MPVALAPGHAVAAALIATLAVYGTAMVLAKGQVIRAGRLIDGVSRQPCEHVSILIHDDRTTGVQDGFVAPAGAHVRTCYTPGVPSHKTACDGTVRRRPTARGRVTKSKCAIPPGV
jgi:hypothetical protein